MTYIPQDTLKRSNTVLRRIKQESDVFDALAKPENWHPNVLLNFLHTPDYIFLERAADDLFDYVTRKFPVGVFTTNRFLHEILNGASWLGQMAILHGDVQIPNILFDGNGRIKLCDFDNFSVFG